MTVRTAPGGVPVLYLLNHAASDRTVALPSGAHRDLLSGATLRGLAPLAPRGVLLLQPIDSP